MILSLRTRLIWGIVIGTAVLLAVFSAVVFVVIRNSMIEHFDASLLNTAHLLTAVIEDEGFGERREDNEKQLGRKLDFEFDVRMTPEFNQVNGGAYYQVWDMEGNTLLRSPSLADHNLECLSSSSSVLYREVVLPDQRRGRAISYQFVPRVGDEFESDDPQRQARLVLMLAQRADEMYEHLQFLMWVLIGASGGVVVLSAGIAAVVTRISLKPVHTLAGRIEDIREDNLSVQFCRADYPAELRPICQCLNDAFGRIAASFQREKQFNANVAHELRTPLAGMQSILEVSLTRPRESAEYTAAIEDCLQIVAAMNKMIDTLLTLSRLDTGQIAMNIETLKLSALVEDAWRFFADSAHDKQIEFDNRIETDAVCQSDKEHLGMILSNVLHNAVDYTPAGGRIWANAARAEGQLIVSICNTGCELTDDEAGRVFDFFWRKSDSRTDTGRHCGIGLSVAQKVAQALGIKLDITVNDGTFCLNLHFAS